MPAMRKGRDTPVVHIVRLAEQREITPHQRLHPNDEDR
jgi:hypothetical protein